MKKRIFISYSRDDESFAEDLERRLREMDRYDVRRDRRVLSAGEDWWRQLQAEIETADTLVLCVSRHSLKSDNVRAEWRHAKKAGTRVIPVAANAIDYKALPKWLTRVHIPALYSGAAGFDETWAGFIYTLDEPYIPHFAPLMGDPPEYFVNRPEEYDRIKRALLDESGSYVGITGVVGGGGFGKTTLAQAVSRDEDVLDWFYDGILWLTLGEAATEDTILAGVRDLIKRMTGKDATETTRDGLKSALRDAITDRYVLIVLDDVWNGAYRSILDSPGSNTRILVTTRKPNLLPHDAQSTDVNAMKDSEAHALLCRGLPNDNAARLGALAKQLGYWALLLKLANGQLRRRIARGAPLDQAISWVLDSLQRKGFEALTDPEDPNARNRAASASLRVSIAMLDELECNRFVALSIFPEDVDIPLTTLAQLWTCEEFDVEECCEALFGLSLLLTLDLKYRSVRLHDVVRTYLRDTNRESLPRWNKMFLDTFALTDWTALPQTEIYLWRHLAWHLSENGQNDVLSKLLTDFKWLQAKLNATDSAALLADFDIARDDQTLQLIQSAVRLSLNVITADKRQLAPQLISRLHTHREQVGISALFSDVVYPSLTYKSESLHFPSHVQAGGSLIQTLNGHSDAVNGALAVDDGRFLSWSIDGTLRLWRSDGSPDTILIGHDDEVLGALALPDGDFLSWSYDSTLRLWRSDGSRGAVLTGHNGSVTGALALADGRFLSWSDDKTLRLWRSDGSPDAILTGHNGSVTGALALTDGRFLSWSDDNTLRLWRSDGSPDVVLIGHNGSVTGALALADGRFLSWSKDKTLRLWRSDGSPDVVLAGHDGWVIGALALADGRFISWSHDSRLRLWHSVGSRDALLEGHYMGVRGALALADGRFLSWSDDNTLRLWLSDGSPDVVLIGHSGPVTGALTLADGRFLSWSEDNTLRLWRSDGSPDALLIGHDNWGMGALALEDGRFLSWSADRAPRLWHSNGSPDDILTGHGGWVIGALVIDDGRVLSWSEDKTLRLWDSDGSPDAILEGHGNWVIGALALDDGRFLSWSHDRTLRLWRSDGSPDVVLAGHGDGVLGALALGYDRFLSWSYDSTLRLWHSDGTVEAVLTGHDRPVTGALALADGRFLSWSEDKTLRLWHSDGSVEAVLTGHDRPVTGALALADGRFLSWSEDKTLRLWRSDGSPDAVLTGHEAWVIGAQALTDGRFLSWSDDDTLRLWHSDGSPDTTLTGHDGWVIGALALNDGRFLSWSEDKTLRLWRSDGSPDATLTGHGDGVLGALVLADSRFLSRSRDNTLRLWDRTGELIATFYGDSSIICCVVSSQSPLRVVLGDSVGRVIFLQLVE